MSKTIDLGNGFEVEDSAHLPEFLKVSSFCKSTQVPIDLKHGWKLDDLTQVADKLTQRMSQDYGVARHATTRSGFEGWLKTVLMGFLYGYDEEVYPEVDFIDLVGKDTAFELKTVPTSYKDEKCVERKARSKKTVKGILRDITGLREKDYKSKFVVFPVYPLNKKEPHWEEKIGKIKSELRSLREWDFKFNNGIPGRLYIGEV